MVVRLRGVGGQRTQPVKRLADPAAALARALVVVGVSAAAAARTSHALTDSRSRPAACSMSALSCSGRRRLMRAVRAPRRLSGGAGGAASAAAGSAGARGDDEVGLAAAQAQLDGARGQLARDVVGGGRQRIEQHQPDRRIQRSGQALSERAGFVTAGVGGDGELAAEVLDVGRQVHGRQYGTTVVPLQANLVSAWCQAGSRGPGGLDVPAGEQHAGERGGRVERDREQPAGREGGAERAAERDVGDRLGQRADATAAAKARSGIAVRPAA